MPYTDRTYDAFARQRKRAYQRGIAFEFSYEEWINWWKENLGPHWRRKRGLRRHQFVMARKRDTGPYSIENVECITAAQNMSDSHKTCHRKYPGATFTGRKHSEKTKKLMSKKHSGKNNPFWGKKHTEEARAKMRLKNRWTG